MPARPSRAAIHPDWLQPDWRLPGVGAVMTTRAGGVGSGPFESLNLRDGLGDEPANVARNQALLAAAVGVTPVYLQQVHGTRVVHLTEAHPHAALHTADASVTTTPGIACTAQVADCLPVLFAAPGARAVAAAHAGWRGLALGVLDATVEAVCEAGQCPPDALEVWLGACIGPRCFEVGADVLDAFGARPEAGGQTPVAADGTPRFVPHTPGKWLANLPLLARDRLQAAGVRKISGGGWCTVENRSRFFSFRRDRVTGRMAALIWIEPGR